MGNYRGYFRAFDNNDLFEVQLIKDDTTSFTEVMMAGEEPFVVTYDNSNTIYDPVRTSKATIKVVNNVYMDDIFSPYAQGTKVILKNNTKNTIEWVGYLTPRIYNQGYDQEYEVIELEAEDCLSTLQYIDYIEDVTAHTKDIVTFKSILNRICDACGLLDGYYWPRTKKVGSKVLLPDDVMISEYNFFTTDTDECWKLDEMLKEICQYFGMTALQWKNRLYFVDYQSYHNNDDVYYNWFSKSSQYTSSTTTHIGSAKFVTASSFKSSGSDISFKPIYNKAVVKANMNTCEDFVPTPFEDEDLENRRGDFFANYEVSAPRPYRPEYPNGTSWFEQKYVEDCDVDDDAKRLGDSKYRYFHRLYDHKNWESLYYYAIDFRHNPQPAPKSQIGDLWSTETVTTDYVGATIVDLGVVRNEYYDEYQQHIVPSKLDYTRYICVNQAGQVGNAWIDVPVFRLSQYKAPCFLDTSKSYIIIDFKALCQRYFKRPYINPDWTNEPCKHGGSGSSANQNGEYYFRLKIGNMYWSGKQWVENATGRASLFKVVVEKDEGIGEYNKERGVLNNISWDEYINEEGYKIPLDGVDLFDDITFEILMPTGQYIYQAQTGGEWLYSYNQYVWFSDLKIKCAQVGQDGEEQDENDITYENVIDEDAVSKLSDITVKITSYSDMTKPSYSNVIYVSGDTHVFLTEVKEDNIDDSIAQRPEENIIQKLVQQYNTQTRKFNVTLNMNYTPFDVVNRIDVEDTSKRFVQTSTSIDYKDGKQEITYEEIK